MHEADFSFDSLSTDEEQGERYDNDQEFDDY